MGKDNSINLDDSPNVGRVVIIEKTNSIDKFLNYIIPILTLILGIYIERKIEKSNRKRSVLKSGKRWNSELKSLKEPIEEQIKHCRHFIDNYTENSFTIPGLAIFHVLKGDNLKSLDKSDFLDFIESKLNNDDSVIVFNKVSAFISILETLNNDIQINFEEFKNRSSRYTESFSRNLQEYIKILRELNTLQKNPQTFILAPKDFKQLSKLFLEHIEPHLEDGNMNPFELESKYFIPNIELLSKYHANPAIISISNTIANCMNDIKGLRFEKIYIKDNLKFVIDEYILLLRMLDDILGRLKLSN